MTDERGCGGAGCILAREAGGLAVGVCRCLPRELHPEDRMRLAREITAQRDELRALRRARDVRAPGPQHERGGVREALRVIAPVDPWAVLRAILAMPLVAATEVDELAAIRELLDEVLGERSAGQ